MKRSLATALTGAFTLVLLAGCSSSPAAPEETADRGTAASTDLTPLTFQLNSTAGGYNAGFFYALEEGYYEEAGLDVTIAEGNGSVNTSQLVAGGDAGIAFSDPLPTMGLIAQGAPITVAATVFQSSPNGITTLTDNGITEVGDLVGKTVAVPTGLMQEQMWPLLLERNDIDPSSVETIKVAATGMIAQLLQGQVDAILGSADNYSIQVAQQGAEPYDIAFADSGLATIAHSIIVNTDWAAENADIVTKFIEASMRGWQDAAEDREGAVEAVAASFPDTTDHDRNLLELDADIPLLCTNGAEHVGKATEEAWEETWSTLVGIDALSDSTEATDFYTYDYLPAELEACK
jgi:NitT/TauT family transport system substrate-binding protein